MNIVGQLSKSWMSVMRSQAVLLLAAMATGLTACAPMRFEAVPQLASETPEPFTTLFADLFKVSVSESSATQPQLEVNQTSIAFQAVLPNGEHLTNLAANDFTLVENDQVISNFKLQSNSRKIVKPVDIVFAVDITGSMTPTIESAKTRLISFIKNTRTSGHHTRMCLLTFGDYTVKRCDRFYDNNPADPSTEAQVKELISEVTKLKALFGPNDPGGFDDNENPMRALIDAAAAPWLADSQRFTILITDDGFLFSPNNQGSVGTGAPFFQEVLEAISRSQMRVFASTPSYPGYNSKFGGLPGIVEASQGEWFNFADMISGRITLDTVLNRILNRLLTTYIVEYNAEESMGLDGSLPLSKRTHKIILKNGKTATINIQAVQSNLPNGRHPYPRGFRVADRKIDVKSVKVKVNGVPVSTGYTIDENGDILFASTPPPHTKVDVQFSYLLLRDSIQLAPITLSKEMDVKETVITLNGKRVGEDFIEIKETLEGQRVLSLKDAVLDEADPFGIRAAQGLEVVVKAR